MAVKGGILYRASLVMAPWLYRAITGLLFASCRLERPGLEHYQRLLASGKPFIVAFWHYSLVLALQQRVGPHWVAMVSASSDAEYVSRILQSMGMATARGSRGKGGFAALREMLAVIKREGSKAAIVADGSQGPPLKVQAGVILLASKAAMPILPLAAAADRYWTFRSWDRTILPKPFAKLTVCFDAPLTVPAALSPHEFEEYRQQLEEQMVALYGQAWGRFGTQGHVTTSKGG